MSRHMRPLSPQQLTSFDLETCMTHAAALHQRNAETYPTPFPKAPTRWLSHDHSRPRPLALTSEGEVEGGRRWLSGATIDVRFTRALCAPSYAPEGGYGSDPASAFFLAIAAKVDRSCDDASCCHALRQHDKGQRYRDLAGLQNALPGEDDVRNCRRRVGASALDAARAVFGDFFREFGLLKGEWLATDGQREPPSARCKGWASCCQGCQAFRRDDASRHALCAPRQSGAKRLQLRCPFPDVVAKVRQRTATTGTPREPMVAWLAVA